MLFGPSPSLLPPGNLVILPNSDCGLPLDSTQMCARNGFFLFESCTADKGGALTIKEFNVEIQEVLVGVVTSDGGCPTTDTRPDDGSGWSDRSAPARYTRLGPHYEWLLEVTRGTTHCVKSKIFRDHHKKKLVAVNTVDA